MSYGHYLIKYDGTKRIDYIGINRMQWHRANASKKPLTKKAAMDIVRETLKESPDIIGYIGGIKYQKDGKTSHTLSPSSD